MPPLSRPKLPSLVVALLCGLLGAGQHAPALLAEAQQLVERARLNLEKGEYRQARDDADLARAKAMEARRLSEAATSPPAGS
jgi:hypothetical protein